MKFFANTIALSAALASYAAAQSSSVIESSTGTLPATMTMTSGLPTGTMTGPLPSGTGAPGEFPPGTGPGLPLNEIKGQLGVPVMPRPGGPNLIEFSPNFLMIFGSDIPAAVTVQNTPIAAAGAPPPPAGYVLFPDAGAFNIQVQTAAPPVEARFAFRALPNMLPPGKTLQDLAFAMMMGTQWMVVPTIVARDEPNVIVHEPQNADVQGTWVVLVKEMMGAGGMGGMGGSNGTTTAVNGTGTVRVNSSSISTTASWVGAVGAIAVASLFV
ncbi:hypothetical protein HDV05_005637 [Chytridiales sp. JEL 0842]|nr:hypothetical protein HDV05_005637 [Chytridiales sp. JEL 0842]